MSSSTRPLTNPYDFVPLLNKCERKPGMPHCVIKSAANAEVLYSGRMRLSLLTRAPLHIGSGYDSVDSYAEGMIVKQTMRRAGNLIIPGSTLKGVVRGIAEAVSHSCTIDIPNPASRKEQGWLPKDNQTKCYSMSALCPVCSIFGLANDKNSYRGKVMFGELTCEGNPAMIHQTIISQESPYNEPELYATPKENGLPQRFLGRKFYRTGANGYENNSSKKRVTLEMIPIDTEFSGEIAFHNLSRFELSLLAFSFGLDGTLLIPMGYAKAYGYGKVLLRIKSVDDMLSRYGETVTPELTAEDIHMLAAAYYNDSQHDIQEAVEALRNIIRV